jgi:DNA-binding LacI/PurR family transcriptional regulator
MVIASSGGEVEKERELIQALTERRIDALVIASVDSNGNQITKQWQQRNKDFIPDI